MRSLAFAGRGMALGCLYFAWVRHATESVHFQRTPLARRSPVAMVAMVLRLGAFAAVLGIRRHTFGPLAWVPALVGGTATRSLMARAEPKPQGY